jgi:hypothetical protein
MEIEPTRTAPKSRWKAAFYNLEKAARDRRANFRVMRDNVRLRKTTPPFSIKFPLSTPHLRVPGAAIGQ